MNVALTAPPKTASRAAAFFRSPWSLWLLFVLAFALRLGHSAFTTGLGRTTPNHLEYILAGERLLKYRTLLSPLILDDTDATVSALLPPLYVGWVAFVYAIFGSQTVASTLILQLVNAAATSWAASLSFQIARRLAGTRAAWIAGGIVLLHPACVGFTRLVWDTSLFTLGVVLTLQWSIRLTERPFGAIAWLGFGLWLGGLALLNPGLTFAYPLLVLWPLTRLHGWRSWRVIRGVSLVLLGWAVAIAPWTVRNWVQLGKLAYIRTGLPLELWLGVCPEADPGGASVYPSQFPLRNPEVQRHVATVGEAAFITESGQKASEGIRRDPLRFARLTALRAADYWAGTVFIHSASGAGWPETKGRLLLMAILLAEVLAIATLLVLVRHVDPNVWWMLGIVVVFSLIYCVTHVEIRFRAPTEPIMAILLSILATAAINHPPPRRPSPPP